MAEFFKIVWKRITSSKVAWMSIPAALAPLIVTVFGIDIESTLLIAFESVWGLLVVFLGVNNPDDTTSL